MNDHNFTIEDIHKLRYENYEVTKNFTHQELLEHTRNEAAEGMRILNELRSTRKSAINQ